MKFLVIIFRNGLIYVEVALMQKATYALPKEKRHCH